MALLAMRMDLTSVTTCETSTEPLHDLTINKHLNVDRLAAEVVLALFPGFDSRNLQITCKRENHSNAHGLCGQQRNSLFYGWTISQKFYLIMRISQITDYICIEFTIGATPLPPISDHLLVSPFVNATLKAPRAPFCWSI